uniref:Ribulose bisphosphate carboxylase/oxygenase activase, chloroplastic n=2 Tax=Triticum TaxID=4564 RepID=A0A8R7Q544_TRIUA
MAAAFSSTVGAPASTPTNFLGKKLKKQVTSAVNYHGKSSKANRFTVMAAENIDEKRNTDKWKGLAYDISDDQQDITRGKGIVDSLFQAPTGDGTHEAVLSSYEYVSQGLKKYDFDNTMGGFYIAPAFMDKLVVHLSKNFMTLPNIKIPLILGIWGGKGQGKSFQCELVFAKMGINPIMMSAGELESGNAGEPAKLIRQRYREAADMIKKGKMCCLFINDLDAGAGRMGGTTQYTVNNQMVNATLMNIADAPTNVQLPGMYNKEENPRVPIVVTGNDFSTLYAPLIRDGRMEKFYWAPTRDEVRKWVTSTGIENIGKKLVNSRDGPVTFEQPKMTVEKLLEYGHMLVQEQDNVKRVQLADTYMSQAALGDANQDAMKTGSFYGKGAQQGTLPVPAGCTDQTAKNFDPTARSDDGSCLYTF